MCWSSQVHATGVLDSQVDDFDKVQKEETLGLRNGSVVVAPIPFSNPTIGSGLVLGAGYLFNIDEGSDPSLLGLAALRSDNGSEGYGLAANFYFNNNRWQIETLFANAAVNYDLYTPAAALPISQSGILARASLSYGFTHDASLGLSLRYLNTDINPAVPGLPPIPPPFNQFLNVEIANVGFVGKWDTRDDTIYPSKGFIVDGEVTRGYTLAGVTDDYSKGWINFTHYMQPFERAVIATRLSTCAVSTSTPFFDQCSLGGTDGFRGFSATQFLDFRSLSAQIEFRRQFTDRLGAIAFAGVGMVGPQFNDLKIGGTHSSYGLGARYRVSKKFPVDFSVDYSRNSEREDQLYIYVGQRF
ncbi:BamA/TamA family outer membrane protein [Falsiruegeria litorea]|uniref:BamA/TamA family outer membrane protein n=1 Tax=Falsiruegeria litorea TaxID=1280831 RepID=UPI001F385958|nr:BamA/TamA family outer membrane protein [Falsiruegeria litorea]